MKGCNRPDQQSPDLAPAKNRVVLEKMNGPDDYLSIPVRLLLDHPISETAAKHPAASRQGMRGAAE
jgi:hypothetical protein